MHVRSGMAAGETEYEKVVIYLHGGGGDGDKTAMLLEYGMLGNEEELKGIKFVFPTSFRDGGIWYETYKNGCGN